MRAQILNAARLQFEPLGMRPRLVEIFKSRGKNLPNPRIAWENDAGMGSTTLTNAGPEEARTVRGLVKAGHLVPTWTRTSLFATDHFHVLEHFDDVQWARDDAGRIVIYQLHGPSAQQDEMLTPGKAHRTALDALEHRINYAHTLEDTPITLRGYGIVTPILTDERQVHLRRRQLGLAPGGG